MNQNQSSVQNCSNCQDLNFEVINLTRDKSDLEYSLNASERKLKAVQQEYENLQQSHKRLQETQEKSDSSLGLKMVENDELTNKVLEFSGRITQLDTDNKVMKMKITSLEEENDLLTKENDRLHKELLKYKSMETTRNGQETPEEENKRLKRKIIELEGEVRRLKEDKEREEREKDLMKDMLAAEQTKHHDEVAIYKKMIGDVIGGDNDKKLEEIIKGLLKKYEVLKQENLHKGQEIENFEKKLQEKEKEMNEMGQENGDIKKEVENYKEKIGVLDEMKKVYQYKEIKSSADEFKNFYDCRILADSFFPLLRKKSWPIEFKDHKSYLETKDRASVRVSVLGYEKTGKSFMISKIMGYEVPQGKLTKTTGICILYPNDTNIPWTALDTPGTNISLRTEYLKNSLEDYFKARKLSEEEMLRMLYGDNILIESLLHEFVANNSQVLLILVGKLRRDDQRFINRIKEQKDYQNKRIIVVHNLLDCRELEDVEDIIQEDIIDTFGAQKRLVTFDQQQKERYPYVYLEKDKRDTEHVIMAHETSPAGEYYNMTAITYVKQVISSNPFSEKFDLVEAFHQHLNMSVKNYLSSSLGIPANPFLLCKDKEGVPNSLSLGNADIYHLKKNSTDEFGQIRTYARDGLETVPFAVKIITKTTPGGEEKYLQVDFEVAGECKDNDIKYKVQTFNTQVIVMIKGKSEDNTMRGEGELVCETTRKFGEFLITTESIDLEGFTIFKGEKPEITSPVPGIKTVSFRLWPQVTDDDF